MYTPRRKYILTFLEQNHEGSISELAQKLNVVNCNSKLNKIPNL